MPNFNFQKIHAGDPFRYSAGFHNSVIDALKWVDAQRNRGGCGPVKQIEDNPWILWVKNTTGVDLNVFQVAAIDPDNIPVGPGDNLGDFQQRCTTSVIKAATTGQRLDTLVVTAKAIPINDIGPAYLGGIVPVLVQFASEDDYDASNYATNDANAVASMKGNVNGGFPILWADAYSSGPIWCLIRMPPEAATLDAQRCSATLADDLASGDGTIDVDHVVAIDGGASPLDDPEDDTETIEVANVKQFRAKDDAVCVIVKNQATGEWELDWVKPLATRLSGTAATAVSGSGSFTLNSAASLDDNADVPTGTVTVYPVLGFTCASAAELRAWWNGNTGHYETITTGVAVQIRWNNSSLHKLEYSNDGGSTWTTIDTAVTC